MPGGIFFFAKLVAIIWHISKGKGKSLATLMVSLREKNPDKGLGNRLGNLKILPNLEFCLYYFEFFSVKFALMFN